jgi:hypothetical protein
VLHYLLGVKGKTDKTTATISQAQIMQTERGLNQKTIVSVLGLWHTFPGDTPVNR